MYKQVIFSLLFVFVSVMLTVLDTHAALRPLQLQPGYDNAQPILHMPISVQREIKDKTVKVAIAGKPQPPLYMDADSRRFEGIAAEYLSLLQTMLEIDLELYHFDSQEEALRAVKSGEMQLMALYQPQQTPEALQLIAGPPWLLDYSVIGQITANMDSSSKDVETLAWTGSETLNTSLLQKFTALKSQHYPSQYDAVAAVIYNQADKVLGNAATLTHLNHYFFSDALTLSRHENSVPLNVSFGISPHFPELAEAVNQAMSMIPLANRMQIANRWQLNSRHVMQSNPLGLTPEEETWLQMHPSILATMTTELMPLIKQEKDQQSQGMAQDLLNMLAHQGNLTFITSGPTVHDSRQTQLPRINPLKIMEKTDKDPTVLTRPWLVSHWVVVTRKAIKEKQKSALSGRNRVAVLKNETTQAWLNEQYPRLQILPIEKPLEALNDLKAQKIDAVILPKIFADYHLHNRFSNVLIIEKALDVEAARFVMSVDKKHPELVSILDKALLATPPQTLFKLLAGWRQAETPLLITSWQNYKQTILLVITISAGLMLLVILWNYHLRQVIQKRTQAENALKNQLNFTHTLFNDSPVAMCIRDKQMRLVDCNKAYLRFFNVDEKDVLGKKLSDIIDSNNAMIDSIEQSYQQTLLSGEVVISDIEVNVEEQTYSLYHWTLPFRDRLEEVVGVIGGWVDVSERNVLLRELQLAKEEAEKANQSKSDFLASMSHEIRTPLHAIIGLLEMENRQHPENLSENVKVAYGSARALLALLGNILDLSKIESGLHQPTLETVYLPDVVNKIAALFYAKASNKKLQLLCEIDVNTGWIKTDPLILNQILSNLLSNAIKFTDQGAVSIVLIQGIDEEAGYGEFVVEVSDSGCGLTEEQRQAIFEPFVQVGSRQQQQLGTGLGLSICRHLADLLNGELRVESEPGEGSVFSFAFRASHSQPSEFVFQPVDASPHPEQLSILIIDDHAPNRLLLGKQLEFAGHQVMVTESASQALAVWNEDPQRFDLIITDCNMPGMNGFEFARALRKEEAERGLMPATLYGLTASAERQTIQRCLDAGMDDCLFKPLDLGALQNYLTRCTHKRSGEPASKQLISPPVKAPGEANYTPLFSPLLTQLAEKDPAGYLMMLQSIQTSHATLLKAIQQSTDRDTLSELGHKLKGGAQILNATVLEQLGRELENNRTNKVALAPLIENITNEIKNIDQQLINSQG